MNFAHYIGGEWVGDSDVTTNTSPANRDDVIGTYARGDAARVCLLYTSDAADE